jgi:hypothetical protein
VSAVIDTEQNDAGLVEDEEYSSTRSGLQRRSRSTRLFAAFALLGTAGVAALGFFGYKTTLQIKGTPSIQQVDNPSSPGYVASVSPTPVHFVALLDANGSLSAIVHIVPSGSAGGTMVWMLGELITQVESDQVSLAMIYAERGMEPLREAVASILGFGSVDVITVGPADLATLVEPVGAISLTNPDALATGEGKNRKVQFPAGTITLEPEQLGEFLTMVSTGEAPENRSVRFEAAMKSLLKAIKTSSTPPATGLTTDTGTDLSQVLTGLAAGESKVIALPVTAQPYAESFLYSADEKATATALTGVVEFPISGFPGQLARVKVLNGTTDLTAAAAVAPKIGSVGAEVQVIGNADSTTATATTVEYSDEAFAEIAKKIGAIFGVTPVRSETLSDASDISVVLGPEVNA